MADQRLRNCFISAPLGVDTQPLRNMLREREVEYWTALDSPAGISIHHAITSAIDNADFICAVIPEGPTDVSTMLELGIAFGLGRPCLLFVAPKADLPMALRGEPYARASLNDTEAIRFQLDAFLKNAGKSRSTHGRIRRAAPNDQKRVPVSHALHQLTAWETQVFPPHQGEIIALLAGVFEAAGFIASTDRSVVGSKKNTYADLAVWIDDLQTTIGNPLVIEVAAKTAPIDGAFWQLRRMLIELRSPLGLLVYLAPFTPPRIPESSLHPIIVPMAARDLVESIGRGDFTRMLLARRNAIAHSSTLA